VCRHNTDSQIPLEIGHVLSNIRKLPLTIQTSTPSASVNSTEHDVVRSLDRGAKASGDNGGLQFDSINDQRFADYTQAARLVQKNESGPAGMFDVNDQWEFSNPGRGIAARALREAFTNVRVEHK
jgi:hypothetical protein